MDCSLIIIVIIIIMIIIIVIIIIMIIIIVIIMIITTTANNVKCCRVTVIAVLGTALVRTLSLRNSQSVNTDKVGTFSEQQCLCFHFYIFYILYIKIFGKKLIFRQ